MRAQPVRATAMAILALALAAAPAAVSAPAQKRDNAKQMKAIVRAWSNRLNASDNTGIARLFAVPALVIQAPYVYRLATRAEIASWYAGLPCAGHVISITVKGRYATAVFKLANRGTSPCDAPGTLAAARFEITRGKIISWEQVPVPKQKAAAAGPTVA